MKNTQNVLCFNLCFVALPLKANIVRDELIIRMT
jgi:hypothetical protein